MRSCSAARRTRASPRRGPTVTDEVGFAEKMNSMPKYVVSRTLESGDWNNTTVINGDVAEEVAKLRARRRHPRRGAARSSSRR